MTNIKINYYAVIQSLRIKQNEIRERMARLDGVISMLEAEAAKNVQLPLTSTNEGEFGWCPN